MRAHKSHHFDRSISSFQSSHRHRHRNRRNYKPFLSLLLFNFFAVLILTNINILEWLRSLKLNDGRKQYEKERNSRLCVRGCLLLFAVFFVILVIYYWQLRACILLFRSFSFLLLPWYAVHATKVDAVLRLLLISWIYYCFCCRLSFSIFFVHI